MGCLFSIFRKFLGSKLDEARVVSKKIDRDILMELRNEPDEIEILLLGAPECGKSTLLKQMRIIHKSDYTLEEKLMFKPIVYANTIHSMSIILHAVERLGISLESEESEYNAYMFYQLLEERTAHSHTLVEDIKITPDLGRIIAVLWEDKGIQDVFARANEYNLSDCAHYFLSNVKRLSDVGYVPTTQDILHTRVKTSGIVEVKFTIKDMIFRLHDVGGQKSERRKWLELFDCVHAVAFCVALTTYELTAENTDDKNGGKTGKDRGGSGGGGVGATTKLSKTNNKMVEAWNLFTTIANSQVFIDAAIILFLTKTDLFQERLKRKPITIAFPEYTGTQEYDESLQFISNKFKTVKKKGPKVHLHITCTTDTNNMRFALSSVTDMLIKNYLQDCGIY